MELPFSAQPASASQDALWVSFSFHVKACKQSYGYQGPGGT